jgi:hypothetical protein
MQIKCTIWLKGAFASYSSFISHSHAWRMCQLLLYDIASDDTQHPAPIHAPGAFVPSAPGPDCACATIPFVHKPRKLDRDRIVVLVSWDGWPKTMFLRDRLTRKHGAKHGNAVSCPTPESTWTPTTTRETVREPRKKPGSQSALLPIAFVIPREH